MAELGSFEIAQLLLDCAYNAVDHTDPWAINRRLITGGEVAWDNCECGQLAVSFERKFPSMSFPLEEVDHESNCGGPWLVNQFLISLARCWPSTTESAMNPAPTPEAITAAAQQLDRDMTMLRRGIGCCLDEAFNTHAIAAWEIGAQEVNGPQGACIETTLLVYVGQTMDCGC